MKKTLLALAVLAGGLFAANSAQAQMVPGSELSIGVSPMLPVGKDFKDGSSFGIGGDLQYGYNFDESVGLTLSAGYNNFFPKEQTIGGVKFKGSSLGVVPVKAGVKYGIGSFYFHPQLGVALPVTTEKIGNVEQKLKSGFLYGIGVGTNVAGFDVSLRYEASDHKGETKLGNSATTSDKKVNLGFVGLRIGYAFPLNR